jgi:integrase
MDRWSLHARFKTLLGVLGPRAKDLSIRSGRHTFASTCLAAGCTIVEVAAWLGHSNPSITAAYLHLVPRTVPNAGTMFQKDNANESQRNGPD